MAYLLWFVIVGLIFVWMHYFTELSGRQKGVISLIVTLIIAGGIGYNAQSNAESRHISEVELKFRKGEVLRCNDINVTNKSFTYSVGTQSFIGNEDSRYPQQIISTQECK